MFLEEAFALQMHLHMQYSDVIALPVRYRKWFVDRLLKHFNDVNNKSKQSNDEPLNIGQLDKFDDMIKQKFST